MNESKITLPRKKPNVFWEFDTASSNHPFLRLVSAWRWGMNIPDEIFDSRRQSSKNVLVGCLMTVLKLSFFAFY
jgi:hypothetical protein